MAYNKAREEKKWRKWKEAEEKQLRPSGVSEDVTERLREADWEDFKAEHRYYEHFSDTGTYIDHPVADEAPVNIGSVGDSLNDIDSEELHRLLQLFYLKLNDRLNGIFAPVK